MLKDKKTLIYNLFLIICILIGATLVAGAVVYYNTSSNFAEHKHFIDRTLLFLRNAGVALILSGVLGVVFQSYVRKSCSPKSVLSAMGVTAFVTAFLYSLNGISFWIWWPLTRSYYDELKTETMILNEVISVVGALLFGALSYLAFKAYVKVRKSNISPAGIAIDAAICLIFFPTVIIILSIVCVGLIPV